MKTAVSIPDDVFADADRLAKRLKTSRSRLYSRALVEYIARHSAEHVTEAIDRVVAEVGETDDAFVRSAARRRLKRTEW